jgi:acetyl esterase
MPLDPQVHTLLDYLSGLGARPLHAMSPAEARRATANFAKLGGRPASVHCVEDRRIPGPGGDVPVRVYVPATGGPFPALVYFHGGGFVTGTIATHDPLCRALARGAGCVVVSVDYRLAPEHRFPAAVEDCYAATCWVAAHAAALSADPTRLAVGGDSAGGNLAAVVARWARDRGGPPLIFQLLFYPVLDYLPDLPSRREHRYIISEADLEWVWGHYLHSHAEGTDPNVAPLRAADLGGLPSALVMTAEFDPVRDEGELYTTRLREAGVPVELVCWDGMVHGFVGMAGVIERGKDALAMAAVALRSAFGSAGPGISPARAS